MESEALYEGITSNESMGARIITPAMMHRPAYLTMQTGGCGYSYGANGVWELQYEADAGAWGDIWGPMAWYDGLELPGADTLTYMRDFYERAGWHRLRPLDNGLFEVFSPFGDMEAPMTFSSPELVVRATPSFTADDEMRTVVGYYKPTAGGRVKLKTLSAESYSARWFDPMTGRYTLIGDDIRPARGCWTAPRRPGKQEMCLLLQANR